VEIGGEEGEEGEEGVLHHFDPKLNAFVPSVDQPQPRREPVDSDEFDYVKGSEEQEVG
jgi:hypothetical protein